MRNEIIRTEQIDSVNEQCDIANEFNEDLKVLSARLDKIEAALAPKTKTPKGKD